MFFVSAQIHSNRLNTCRECKHYHSTTKSCGVLGLGKTVTHKGRKTKLCGCIMPIKAKLKVGSCPLEKWGAEISSRDLNEIQNLLEGVTDRLDAGVNERLTELWNIAAGDHRKVSSCKSCVRKMIADLRILIDQNNE